MMFKKAIGDLLKYATTPAIMIGAIVYFVQTTEQSKERQFDTPEDKYMTKQHIVSAPSAAQEQRSIVLDSINTTNAIKSRRQRDSIFRVLATRQQRMDSINLLNADQMYQIKEEMKKIQSELNHH